MPEPVDARFGAVDALIVGRSVPPSPAERVRLRKAHGLTQDKVASAANVRRATLVGWEKGNRPATAQREVYAHLLAQLARLYPADSAVPEPQAVPAPQQPSPQPAAPRRAPSRPANDRCPALVRDADPRFARGPLAVLDCDGTAYCTGGTVLDCPARTVPQLAEWALSQARLGASRLHRSGMDSDPLIVRTAAAAERSGLPTELEERLGLEEFLDEEPYEWIRDPELLVDAECARLYAVGIDVDMASPQPRTG